MRNGLDRAKGASERIMERLRPLISLCLMSVLVSGLVGGCAVGPNYHKPACANS